MQIDATMVPLVVLPVKSSVSPLHFARQLLRVSLAEALVSAYTTYENLVLRGHIS